MRLRDLKNGPAHAWPPMFGGAYRAGDRFPVGEVGVLKAVRNAHAMPGLDLDIEYEGRIWSGVMQWDSGKPSRDTVRDVLNRHIGKDLRELSDIEVG